MLTAGVAALTAAVATAATWPDQPAAALSATRQGGFRVGSAISATLLGGRPQVYYDDDGAASLRYARLTAAGWQFQTLDGPSSTLPGRTGDHVGSAVAVTQMNGNAQVYYYDATLRSLRHAWWTSTGWRFETLDGPGSGLSGRTGDRVGAAVSVTDY